MSVLTLVHALAVGLVLLAAGRLAEAGLRRLDVPARPVWILLLIATVTAPLWAPAAGGWLPDLSSAAPESGSGLQSLLAAASTATDTGATATVLNRARGWIVPGWVALAALGVGLVGSGLFRLHRQAGRWPRARIGDEPILVSPDFGPAVVGLRRPRTVLPGWSLGLERGELELIVRHEAAHRKARDPLVLAVGVFTAALAPWNPFVWLQVRRLREAVEQDCDRRLLREGVPRVAYARMLLSMRARGTAPGALPIPGLRDTRDSLERRLTTMWTKPSIRRALPALMGSALLVVVACEGPTPTVVAPEPVQAEGGVVQARGAFVEVEATPDAPSPLIVVDGEPREGTVSLLEAVDIHSDEVLKGPAATDRYGDAGRDGVVLVVTREAAEASGAVPASGRLSIVRKAAPGPPASDAAPVAVPSKVVPRVVIDQAPPSPVVDARPEQDPHAEAVLPPPPPGDASPRSEVRIRARPSTGAVRVDAVPPGEPVAAGVIRELDARSGPAPLVYVDGRRMEGIPADLAPEEIERVEVIKGGAAVEIYGPDARDGVIRITTKGGGR
ncbi:MAG TPA: M56 family metallopeptidase [Longimicrobiales bacterium]|nr:M56 family metallopeptidase [Longimicrobiales bacterium]